MVAWAGRVWARATSVGLMIVTSRQEAVRPGRSPRRFRGATRGSRCCPGPIRSLGIGGDGRSRSSGTFSSSVPASSIRRGWLSSARVESASSAISRMATRSISRNRERIDLTREWLKSSAGNPARSFRYWNLGHPQSDFHEVARRPRPDEIGGEAVVRRAGRPEPRRSRSPWRGRGGPARPGRSPRARRGSLLTAPTRRGRRAWPGGGAPATSP
jgi:hypothetical protein